MLLCRVSWPPLLAGLLPKEASQPLGNVGTVSSGQSRVATISIHCKTPDIQWCQELHNTTTTQHNTTQLDIVLLDQTTVTVTRRSVSHLRHSNNIYNICEEYCRGKGWPHGQQTFQTVKYLTSVIGIIRRILIPRSHFSLSFLG